MILFPPNNMTKNRWRSLKSWIKVLHIGSRSFFLLIIFLAYPNQIFHTPIQKKVEKSLKQIILILKHQDTHGTTMTHVNYHNSLILREHDMSDIGEWILERKIASDIECVLDNDVTGFVRKDDTSKTFLVILVLGNDFSLSEGNIISCKGDSTVIG